MPKHLGIPLLKLGDLELENGWTFIDRVRSSEADIVAMVECRYMGLKSVRTVQYYKLAEKCGDIAHPAAMIL